MYIVHICNLRPWEADKELKCEAGLGLHSKLKNQSQKRVFLLCANHYNKHMGNMMKPDSVLPSFLYLLREADIKQMISELNKALIVWC